MILRNLIMDKITLVLIIAVMLSVGNVNAVSCQYGRGACIASCMAQNCATGYCTSVPDGVCVCSRCSSGPPW